MDTRIEHDLLGDAPVLAHAWYGIQTQRALENFSLSGTPISAFPELIRALARVKAAAARANHGLGLLSDSKASAIAAACDDIVQGALHDQFVVDLIQGGAGTSTNMNANEVIANLALAKLGHGKGEYRHLHPNNDVNCSQSTNDAYPTAARLAMVEAVEPLKTAIEAICLSLEAKGREFGHILKMGRTQLQDAVPMTLGQEFDAFAASLKSDIARIDDACKELCVVNLGGTAIGTGINTHPAYGVLAVKALADITGLPVIQADNLIDATTDMGAFVTLSSVLKRLAVKLSKLSNDLRLLSSGPRTGLGEIRLPAMQPGSSIMPGKVNPVIPEAVNQVAFQVIGTDMTITMAAEAAQLQLNAMEPVIVYNLLNNCALLTRAIAMLDSRCIQGIEANEAKCEQHLNTSIGIVTALVPHIGYENATRIAGEALLSGAGVAELVRRDGLLSDDALSQILSPAAMVTPVELTGLGAKAH
ncbi:aspartate ammonia-lyase [Shewanella sp. FJAT-52076]|uniref:aspartate ammonia-lyase n=1 Tax=Shewanella sp. FJAT-52076 TaxID=2864202 RepID=UPI001C6586A0|nr:aspartate ammonia-lyase [Shewanella sp. FJAT-52076]QYJ76158.1 aspartate ammonia-lyase [Shewanella sp. FJAT-52076]